MVFVESQTRGGKKYYYLSKSIRAEGKFFKERVYLGRSKPSQATLKEKEPELMAKIWTNRELAGELWASLTPERISRLEKLKDWYDNNIKSSPVTLETYLHSFLLTFTYDTNAIEGSTLTAEETSFILEESRVPKGANLREIKEVENHRDAFNFLLSSRKDVSEDLILSTHKTLMHNIEPESSGKYRSMQVYVGSPSRGEIVHRPPSPSSVPSKMRDLISWYKTSRGRAHPLSIAAKFHAVFEGIHPFVDGNGRIGRLILNHMLLLNGYPPIDVRNRDKFEYYKALREHDKTGDVGPLINFLYSCYEKQIRVLMSTKP